MRNARGFTLVEILIALVLLGIVSTALYQMLVANQRLYRAQVQSVAINESVRAAIAILPPEVRELSAGEGDIVKMDETSVQFRSMQALYFQCKVPDPGSFKITVDATRYYGLRAINAATDSVLVFAEGDASTRGDDSWLVADVKSTTAEKCTNGDAAIEVVLDGVTAGQLLGVESGAPVRTFRHAGIQLYSDTYGDWYLGAELDGGGLQPLLGPLSSKGLKLSYYTAANLTTTDPKAVARVAIEVQSQSAEQVYRTTGMTVLLQDLMTEVAVRNNPTY